MYDYSALYTFDWLNTQALPEPERVVNIHAGFDEISPQLQQKFTTAQLRVLDFYDPARHTEVSIQRARAACLPYPGTERVQPETLPLPTGSVDWVIVMLSAHEIRQQTQRIAFLEEARRSLQPRGRLVIVEHLRDPANFMAYTIGFLHFYSRATWLSAFQTAGLTLEQEQKITPFISAFILR
ncbi:class I SAM-dependent methyltransferase [Hymenobacter sp. DG25A]|uniref:class I SAM-dependent methyltransferase n=1 Tax=Hymenobacter sp. DG25A TaxID=1385663 RepID=UPI001E607FA0|nr:methyltransferase domain-containing protein [Hymenobacter sp. DG25A]